MAFKPKIPENNGGGGGDYESGPRPVPKAGSRKARISLIVDMGIQEQEDFVDPKTKETKPQKPCEQVAVFADLTADLVDYGGTIGKAHYRIPVNNVFKGDFKGINFKATPQRDAEGNVLTDKNGKWLPYILPPASLLTKLAKATERPDICQSMDIEQLLNQPFMATVDVKITDDKNGKKDKDDNVIQYKNVNFKGSAPVPHQEDDDGNDLGIIPVPELKIPAMLISFDNAKKEDIKFIRRDLLKKIKLALNYAGSQMEKAVQAHEAENGTPDDGKDDDAEKAPSTPAKPKATPAVKKAAKQAVPQDDDDDDSIPF